MKRIQTNHTNLGPSEIFALYTITQIHIQSIELPVIKRSKLVVVLEESEYFRYLHFLQEGLCNQNSTSKYISAIA